MSHMKERLIQLSEASFGMLFWTLFCKKTFGKEAQMAHISSVQREYREPRVGVVSVHVDMCLKICHKANYNV